MIDADEECPCWAPDASPLPAALPLALGPEARHGGLEPRRPGDRAPRVGLDLEDREVDVLVELARAGDGRTAFQGLRRRLGLHQQALTRTLRRLERRGVVERDERGYALTGQGLAALGGRLPRVARGPMLPVLQALLPPSVTAEDVAERLARRWFRDLRWHGRADAPGETRLTWLTPDTGALVRVRFASGVATVEVEVPEGRSLDSLPAAQALLRALAELYGPAPDGSDAAA